MTEDRVSPGSRPHAAAAAFVAVVAWAWATPVVSASAQEARPIVAGVPVAASLSPGATHAYSIELGEDMFVYGEAVQTALDVVVTVKDPSGEALGRFDSQATGADPFVFETGAAGTYVVEVSAYTEDAAEEDGETGEPDESGEPGEPGQPDADAGASGPYEIAVLVAEPVATDPEARVSQMIRVYDGSDRPGGIVAVVRDGEPAFVRTFGMANLTHGVPWERGTISNIGSVTKQFTAMGLLLLQADGKLSLDDDIREHVPELPDFGTPVTLRHFLNHTSGYREIYNLLPMTGYNGEDAFPRQKAIQVVQRQPDLQSPPNTEWNYNNTGFILLSLVVERVSGRSFADYMRERVFEPLGMSDTRVKMEQGELIPGSAQGYEAHKSSRFRTTRDLASSAGAGGIYTTAHDLIRWMRNYRDATLGGEEAIRAMATPAVLESGDSTGYGLGLGVGELGGRAIYAHTGGDVAHRAYLGYFPELDDGVVVMSNNASFDLGMGGRIARLFFADDLEEDEEEAVADEGDGRMSQERMEVVAGRWVLNAQGVSLDVEITTEDGQLFFQAAGQPRAPVQTLSDSTAAIPAAQASFTFHFEPDGTTTAATFRQGVEMEMRRSESRDLTDEEMNAYVGRYYSEELETYYEVRLGSDGLVLHHLDMPPTPLAHRAGDEFSTEFIFLATIAFHRVGNGQVTGFAASNGRTKGVWFRRLR